MQLNSLNYFFGKNDFPEDLTVWRDNIDKNDNAGLALRWSAAISTMEDLSNVDEKSLKYEERVWMDKLSEIIKGLPILHKENL